MQYEVYVEVEKDDPNKRAALCDKLSVAISLSDMRITKGFYRITFEKIKEIPQEKA